MFFIRLFKRHLLSVPSVHGLFSVLMMWWHRYIADILTVSLCLQVEMIRLTSILHWHVAIHKLDQIVVENAFS